MNILNMSHLIRLGPGTDPSVPVECTSLRDHNLQLEYTAISDIVSPDDPHKCNMTLNGTQHGVSDGLNSTLRHLRLPDDPVLL